MEKLWTAIAFACRLDEDEPTGAWHRRHGELQRRAEVLQSLQLDALRFVDERTGTDLKVGLLAAETPGASLIARRFPFIAVTTPSSDPLKA